MYNKNNFYRNTFCIFKQVNESKVSGWVPSFKSKSGSEYFFTNKGVYRKSNHWGRAANCRWRVIPNKDYKNQQVMVAYANWTDFYPNNDFEKLFYLEIVANEILLSHKDSPNYSNQILRDAKDSAKRIQELKMVLENESWAKHINYESFALIKEEAINLLISTQLKFSEIKQKLST